MLLVTLLLQISVKIHAWFFKVLSSKFLLNVYYVPGTIRIGPCPQYASYSNERGQPNKPPPIGEEEAWEWHCGRQGGPQKEDCSSTPHPFLYRCFPSWRWRHRERACVCVRRVSGASGRFFDKNSRTDMLRTYPPSRCSTIHNLRPQDFHNHSET